MVEIVPLKVGDIVSLKKDHPCGANEWQVNKVGMDIGLECLGCGRKVRVLRSHFDRRFKKYLRRAKKDEGNLLE